MPTGGFLRVGAVLGIPVRLHYSFPLLAALVYLLTPGFTTGAVALALLVSLAALFVSTLAHEVGHCLAARAVRGHAHDIEIWFLGGLAHVEYVRRRGAILRVSLAGVGVNLLLAAMAGAVMAWRGTVPGLPSFHPTPDVLLALWNWNLALLAFNLLPGLPFDGGAAVEGLLLRPLGRVRARMVVLSSGAIIAAGLMLYGFGEGRMFLTIVGGWALLSCMRAYQALRNEGVEEELLLGSYDFSRGYTSLEESASPPPPPPAPVREARPAREPRRRARPAEPTVVREDPRERLDRLLERIHVEGIDALSAEERRFLEEESRRLREQTRPR